MSMTTFIFISALAPCNAELVDIVVVVAADYITTFPVFIGWGFVHPFPLLIENEQLFNGPFMIEKIHAVYVKRL